MAKSDLDLVMALGVPEGGKKPAGEKPGSGSNAYLAKKSPKLRAFLMDAVDTSLSHEERAEALCRALEGDEATQEAPEEEDAPESPVGAGMPFEGEDDY